MHNVNYKDLRKTHHLTQQELADNIGISFQTISKWESGGSLPDISVLPLLANALHCNIDSLLGYAAEQQKITDYKERYKADGYDWGTQPSNMCYEIMKLCPPVKPLRLLDVACGEGKNAAFFQELIQCNCLRCRKGVPIQMDRIFPLLLHLLLPL